MHYLKTPIYSLLLALTFLSSCNGQTQTQADSLIKPKTVLAGQPILIKIQSSNPSNGVACSLQDKAGNLWFGVPGEGVYRYDGQLVTQFTVKDGLNHNNVWCICEDNIGNIWFGTSDGLCRYDGNKCTPITISINAGSNLHLDSSVRLKNKISVRSNGGVTEENSVWSIIQDKSGTLWFGTTDGIYTYDGKTFSFFTHNDGISNNTGVDINKVESILEDRTGKIWFGGRFTDGLFCYDGIILTHLKPDGDNWFVPRIEDKSGNIWFGTRMHSVYRYDSTTKKEHHPKIVRTLGTSCENVGCQLLDKDGNLWFSIPGEGIYRYDGQSFTNLTTKDGLCNNHVGAIIQDRAGNMLLGTKNGICKYDGNKFTKYPVPDSLRITCMLEDKDGNLWFGTMNNGVYRYNGTTLDNFLNKKPYNLGSTNQLILDMLQDKNGNVWFSSWNGGGVWRYDGTDFKNFLPSADYYTSNQDKRNINNPQNTSENSLIDTYSPSEDHITDDMIFSMTEDNSGNIWFATRNHGICRYDGKTFTNIGINEGFNCDGATAILQDDKNNFWITTSDSGVWYYDGKAFKNFTENDGLVNNAVMNMLKDKNGNVWFGTKWFGLSRYDGKTFTTFSQHVN